MAPWDADRGLTMVSELERGQPGRMGQAEAANLIAEYNFALLQSFSEVFGVELLSESEFPGIETNSSAVPLSMRV